LAGEFQLSGTITGYQSQLDTLANTVTTQVNTIYSTGKNAAGTTGANFFNVTVPAGGAASFALDPAIAASSSAIATGTSGSSGDGGVALALSQLQNQTQATLGNQTIQAYYTNFVGAVGSQSQYYTNQVSTQTAVTNQIQSQIQSVSGVSSDDEMANMLTYQRSYQAAAQALATINSTMDSLLGILR
jgi:flagellar hook-associated protein 1 FlgK